MLKPNKRLKMKSKIVHIDLTFFLAQCPTALGQFSHMVAYGNSSKNTWKKFTTHFEQIAQAHMDWELYIWFVQKHVKAIVCAWGETNGKKFLLVI